MAAIFDLDTGNIIKDFIVGYMDIVAHTNIDSGVFNARNHIVLNQTVSTQLRKDAIDAGVDNHIVANLKIVAGLAHNAIAFVFSDAEVFDHHIVAGVENGIIEFAQPIHGGPLALLNNPDQMDIIFIYIHSL